MTTIGLDQVAAKLEGLEETIIHKLIDRAQFCQNLAVYEPGQSGFDGDETASLFDIRLLHQERMDAEFGRFYVPEERPFSPDLPKSRRTVSLPATMLALGDLNAVNLTVGIRTAYVSFIPRFCPAGDDEQYGSSVEHDVYALQAISRRVHFGAMYVAEVKYRTDPDTYDHFIDLEDEEGMLALLTRPDIEQRIIERVRDKVAYIQARVNRSVRSLIDADTVLQFYRDTVIPLTKQGEVMYLKCRDRSLRPS